MWTLFEIVGLHGWLSLIPFANMICMYIALYKLAKKCGKGTGFAICTIFFAIICLPILAFSKDNNSDNNSDQTPVSTNTENNLDNNTFSNESNINSYNNTEANNLNSDMNNNINNNNF